MDLGTTIIGVGILLICIAPFILINMKNQNREKKFVKALFDVAQKNNSEISEYQILNNIGIAIDTNLKKLFCIRIKENKREVIEINLSEIQSCNLINTTRTVNDRGSKHKEIDKIEFIFKNHQKSDSDKIIEIYNADYDSFYVTGELQFAEKWIKIIQGNLKLKH